MYAPDNASIVLNDYEYGAFVRWQRSVSAEQPGGRDGNRDVFSRGRRHRSVSGPVEEGRNYFFDADVALTAEFGDGSELGTISGRIHSFNYFEIGTNKPSPETRY